MVHRVEEAERRAALAIAANLFWRDAEPLPEVHLSMVKRRGRRMGKVLVACEYSGRVREAFRKLGHDAWSCDLLKSEDNSPFHLRGDVTRHLDAGWDLLIAHPPCTRLCNSGVRWLHERKLWDELDDAVRFFLRFKNAPVDRIAVENPVMHKYARERIGAADFTVQPWQFGDDFKKRTCFWTKGLPPLKPTSTLDGSTAYAGVHLASPHPDRWKERSRTYQGIANAMAAQWGPLLC